MWPIVFSDRRLPVRYTIVLMKREKINGRIYLSWNWRVTRGFYASGQSRCLHQGWFCFQMLVVDLDIDVAPVEKSLDAVAGLRVSLEHIKIKTNKQGCGSAVTVYREKKNSQSRQENRLTTQSRPKYSWTKMRLWQKIRTKKKCTTNNVQWVMVRVQAKVCRAQDVVYTCCSCKRRPRKDKGTGSKA